MRNEVLQSSEILRKGPHEALVAKFRETAKTVLSACKRGANMIGFTLAISALIIMAEEGRNAYVDFVNNAKAETITSPQNYTEHLRPIQTSAAEQDFPEIKDANEREKEASKLAMEAAAILNEAGLDWRNDLKGHFVPEDYGTDTRTVMVNGVPVSLGAIRNNKTEEATYIWGKAQSNQKQEGVVVVDPIYAGMQKEQAIKIMQDFLGSLKNGVKMASLRHESAVFAEAEPK